MPSPPPADPSHHSEARLAAKGAAAAAGTPPGSTSAQPPASPTAELPDTAPRQLGEFRIIRPLGRGGMSEVYLAEQISLHRQVAVKVLRPELLSDLTLVKRFEQEAKAAAGLIHPNIVQVYSFGEHEGTHYIAQEYVQGLNLRQYLNRKGPPELLVAYHVMRQVSAALAAAADAGIVHRDIKPENILITRKGETKVADFGLAQLAESEHRVQLTQVGMTMGTPLYMSPEQINGQNVDHRSDLYSFGVTCYRMLSGRPPFRGETTLTLAMQHLTQTPDSLLELRSDLPPVLCDIVHKMMAREPEKRYQHAREILQDLKQVARILKEDSDGAGGARSSNSATARRHKNWREAFFSWSVSRHALLLACAALVVGGGSAALGWRLRPGNPLEAALNTQQHSQIPRLASAKEQFERANKLPSEAEEWRAVIDYFPDDTVYTAEAKERLAVLYLKSRRFEDARRLFDDLEAMGRENETAKAAGIAGKAIIASLQGNYDKSQRLFVDDLADLSRQRRYLSNDLWFLLQRAGNENSRHLGEEADKQLKGLFEDEP